MNFENEPIISLDDDTTRKILNEKIEKHGLIFPRKDDVCEKDKEKYLYTKDDDGKMVPITIELMYFITILKAPKIESGSYKLNDYEIEGQKAFFLLAHATEEMTAYLTEQKILDSNCLLFFTLGNANISAIHKEKDLIHHQATLNARIILDEKIVKIMMKAAKGLKNEQ